MEVKIKYSFIIPVKEINDYIRESIPKILKIQRTDYEIIIYSDIINDKYQARKVRQIATGHIGPAEKRSLAIRDAKGKILIFIDDDAYPEKNLLSILDKDFEDCGIVAVGGPAITPKDDGFWQKVSGAVLSSTAGGNSERYVPKGKKRYVDDWPSVNLAVRKNDFVTIRGFNNQYWPGEDTLLCLDLLKKTKGKIIYDPNLIVYHHRRCGLIKHLKQISQYGLHRGFFAKKYPETSFKFKYFIPSIFFLYNFFFLVSGIFYLFQPAKFGSLIKILSFGYFIYFLSLIKAFSDIYKYEKNILIGLNALYYIFLTHVVYGFQFIKGFVFTKKLKSKLRSKKFKN